MISNIEMTAVKQTGVLGKITIALIQKGHKVVGQSMSNLDDKNLCLIKFGIEAVHELPKSDFEFLITDIPQVVKIHDDGQEKSITQTVAEIDITVLLNDYGQQLVSQYPNIRQLLTKIDSDLPEAVNQEVLTKLGKGFGRWQCNNNYSLGGLLPLDKTLQRMLWPSMEDFLMLEVKGNRVEVMDCPHCFDNVDDEPSCYFITAYIQGFLDTLNHLPLTSVVQLHSKASGHRHCSFEVSSIEN